MADYVSAIQNGDTQGTPSSVNVIVNGKNETWDIKNDHVELLQFTGLKDVNGKKIYVGDVVQTVRVTENWPELNNWISRVGKPFLVENRNYVHGKWIARSVADKGFGVDDWNLGPELLIVGNVHENPELLEADK